MFFVVWRFVVFVLAYPHVNVFWGGAVLRRFCLKVCPFYVLVDCFVLCYVGSFVSFGVVCGFVYVCVFFPVLACCSLLRFRCYGLVCIVCRVFFPFLMC